MPAVRRSFAAILIAAVVLVAAAPRVKAIVYGFVDTTNVYANTGAFMVRSTTGQNFILCSGTLISPTVFLTASHCTSYFENDLVLRGFTAFVSFATTPFPSAI